jgi:hypothetical protein
MEFSVRDLLLVTVIVALAVVWWVGHQCVASKLSILSQKVKAYEKAAAFLGFDSSFDYGGLTLEATGRQALTCHTDWYLVR